MKKRGWDDGINQGRDGCGKWRDGKERGKEEGRKKRGKEVRKISEKGDFAKFSSLEASVRNIPSQSGPNLACKCKPTAYSSMPNFIVIGISCYTEHNNANMTDIGTFWGLQYPHR